jgi:hypothetical protein
MSGDERVEMGFKCGILVFLYLESAFHERDASRAATC